MFLLEKKILSRIKSKKCVSKYNNELNTQVGKITGSHGGQYEDDCLLG
jgi:hypothetical protein